MSFIYKCRHCGHLIGELKKETFNQSQLGFDQLSAAERHVMIQPQENGDICIQSICENCEDSLEQNPRYYELDFFIQ